MIYLWEEFIPNKDFVSYKVVSLNQARRKGYDGNNLVCSNLEHTVWVNCFKTENELEQRINILDYNNENRKRQKSRDN